ncbi:MAG: LacI family DNA-binding transcriptional regulator [Anaerolineae bacterium]|nr:LacI family DNA-binding transcriptional regulator [Anaerolineae bacterium]
MSARASHYHHVTIKDVAREAGVSYSTVSRVLNNQPHIHPDKRQRVLDAAARLGYVVNLQARGLVGGRTQTIGLLLHELSAPYMGLVVQGIDEELAAAAYELILQTTHRHRHKETLLVNTVSRGMIDGLLLLLPLELESYLDVLRDRQFPYVVIDHQGFDDFSPTVSADNVQGAYTATKYLIELGHRRIGFVAGRFDTSSGTDRLAAYKAALTDAGLPFDPDLVQPGAYEQHGGYLAANALLDLPQPPTALFCANDASAFGAYEAIRNRGLRIPQELSVIGFDDIPQAALVHPPLTTIQQPLVEIGRRAARLLLHYIAQPDYPVEHIVMPTRLIVRESCQSPAASSSRRG